jgi:nucleoside diphosphate kinase
MSSDICRAFILKKEKNSKNPFEEVAGIKEEIRKTYGESDMRNVLHSSDNQENMDHEASIFFGVI